jgi:hypothetical protein
MTLAAEQSMYQPNFFAIATKMVAMGAYVVPVPTGQKACVVPNWQNKATRNLLQVEKWYSENQHYNCAIVGKPEVGALWGFDDDSGVLAEYEAKHGAIKTYRTQTVSGGMHLLFKHNLQSIAMGNLSAKNEQNEETWSARAANRYVISAGSVAHPHNDPAQPLTAYTAIDTTMPIEAPDTFISFLREKAGAKTETAKVTGDKELDDESLVHEGGRNNMLASVLGRARQVLAMDKEQLYEFGRSVNQKRCVPPLPDSEVRTIANSIGRYEVTVAPPVILNGMNLSQPQTAPVVEIPKIETPGYPVFPSWILKGCHVYDNYIKEVCEKNCRYPEMMFVPALAITLNYLGTKCHMAFKGRINGSMVNIIGRKGRVMKSTSVQDMFDYYENVGVLNQYGSGTRNAEGKSLVWTAGSTEGVGVSAKRVNCHNMILYFDELKTLSDKAGIEGSSMGGHLLSMLQSGKFANETKSPKGSFQFDPGSYTASVITCCTDRMFVRFWSRLIAFSDGLEDRTTLILQPENLKDVTPRVYVPASPEAIAREKQLIDKAVGQNSYEFEDNTALEAFAKKYGNRSEIRAEEWAVAFAVQMGRDSVTEDCIERGIALETYNIQVKKYLNVREAETREATIQNHIIQILMQSGGSILMRELNKRMRPDRYGTALWYNCYSGLIKNGWTAEVGTGVPGDPRRLMLLRVPENDDD